VANKSAHLNVDKNLDGRFPKVPHRSTGFNKERRKSLIAFVSFFSDLEDDAGTALGAGVGRSNRPAPTNRIKEIRALGVKSDNQV
jgi:hypothetical protein